MVTPLQLKLIQCLNADNILTQPPEQSLFGNRSVKKVEKIQKELKSFLSGSARYVNITDTKLIKRICTLCDTKFDSRFQIKDHDQCAQEIVSMISSYTQPNMPSNKQKIVSEEEPGHINHSDIAIIKQNIQEVKIQKDQEEKPKFPDPQDILVTNTSEHQKGSNESKGQSSQINTREEINNSGNLFSEEVRRNQIPDKMENTRTSDTLPSSIKEIGIVKTKPIKLINKQQFNALKKEVLDVFNIIHNSQCESLENFFATNKNGMWLLFNPKISEIVTALMYFSEEFNGKSKRYLIDYWGFEDPSLSDEEWEAQSDSRVTDPEKLVQSQEDLESIIKTLKYFINDIQIKNRKVTGFEDPSYKFFSAGEFSVHSNDPKTRQKVQETLDELKAIALKDFKSDGNKMRAAIDYAMQKANSEIVHSETRLLGLGFNNNPFLREESNKLNRDMVAIYADGDRYGYQSDDVQNSKFGNCDHFSYKVNKALAEVNYDKGGYGQVLIGSTIEGKDGHSFNFVTQGDKVMIVDAWKNMYFDLADIEHFFPEYCAKDKPFTFRFIPNKKSDLAVITALKEKNSMNDALELMRNNYQKPDTLNY